MKASKGPSATALSLLVVGTFATPFVLTAFSVALVFAAAFSQ